MDSDVEPSTSWAIHTNRRDMGRRQSPGTRFEILSESALANGKDAQRDDTNQQSRIKRAFPTGFKHESVELLKFSWPVVSTQVFSRTIRIMPVIFSGQLGKLELGGVSMAISIVNVSASSIGIGMIAACETAFSQSYGSTNKKQVGVYLQTAMYISTLLCMASWALLLNANTILLGLGQDPTIAKYTEEYLFIFMPAVLFLLAYQLLSRYIQVQGLLLPCVFIGLLANGVDVILQYLLVYLASYGLMGSATAQFITYFVLAAGVTCYIYFTKCYKITWGGWTRSSLQDWGQFFKLAMSTVMMISVEWWAFEISMFLMGILGPVALGANSILFQMWMFYASISLGFGSAIAYCVGRHLGGELPQRAKTSSHAAVVLGLILAVITATITLALRYQLPRLFSKDKDVVALGGDMLPILALFSFFGATKNVCAGVVRGTGRQYIGAVIITASYAVVALPIGVSLMFLTPIGAAGFWWGLCLGQMIAAVCLLVMLFTFNWDVEVERALIRAKIVWKEKHRDRNSQQSGRAAMGAAESYGSAHERDDCSSVHERDRDDCSSGNDRDTQSLTTLDHTNKEKQYTPNYWRNLFILRFTTVCFFVIVLVMGILIRFVIVIPPPIESYHVNTTTSINLTLITLSS